MRSVIAFILLHWQISVSAINVQQPFPASFRETGTDEYQFQSPIRKVAVIGAGPSGLIAFRELAEAGLDVRIFERDNVPGGNWHYTDEIPLDAPVPNAPTAVSDFVPSLPLANVDLPYSEEFIDESGDVWRDHRGPKPVWKSLTSNAASPLQQFPQWPWPAGTPWEVSHYQLRNYVRSYASFLNINSNDENPATAYNTRVEHMEKRVNAAGLEQGWRLWLKSLESTGNNTYRATWWTEDFDAVAVTIGKYNAPSTPFIPGLDEWARRFPNRVRHSRQYRQPEEYAGQRVLIIGAAVSGSQISRDLNHHVREIIQSFRPDTDSRVHNRLENYMRLLPKNTTLVGEIERFLPLFDGFPIQSGQIELKNGTILSGFDNVILATGFRYSFPFLSQYYDGATYIPHDGSAKAVSPFLSLDGTHIRDLFLDLFYIQDPTLGFIGMTLGTQSFSFSEYSTLALAKVWSETAKLPSKKTMRELYEKTVEERGGYGKHLMFLGSARVSVLLRYLIGWLNESAAKYGGKQVDGLPKNGKEIAYHWQIGHYGGLIEVTVPNQGEVVLASVEMGNGEQLKSESLAILYGDEW